MLREIFGRTPTVYRTINRLRGYRLNAPDVRIPNEVIGSVYGGWSVPNGMLDKDSVIYSVGLGEDITFDLGLIRRYNCTVHGFDPTPIARAWLKTQNLPKEFVYHDLGLAEFDGSAEFSAPKDRHSFSRVVENGSPPDIVCQVRKLSTIVRELHHQKIDLLKMDIEGFEYAVLEDIVQTGILPRVLDVEFHHKSYGIPTEKTGASVRLLKNAGYRIFWVSDLGREYGFVHQ